MWHSLLADFVVLIHLLYMAFVIFGQLFIAAGALLGWQWIRNVKFRVAHLLAIVVVALEALVGIVCPLTTWEKKLRELAGEQVSEGSFVGRLMHSILFYELPTWVFTTAYVAFALLAAATWWFVPPRRKPRSAQGPKRGAAA